MGLGKLANFEDLTAITGLAIDASGRVYVADAATKAIHVFRPDGSGGYALLAEWRGVQTPGKTFGEELGGVAIDTSTSTADPAAGDVYVLNSAEEVLDVFKPVEGQEGTLVSVIKGKPRFEGVDGIAVDSATGSVYVANNSGKPSIEQFSSAGAFERSITGAATPQGAFGSIAGLAVEEATGDVYAVDEADRVVQQFNAAGEWIGQITTAAGLPLVAPDGIAVSNSSGSPAARVYVADGGASAVQAGTESVDVFGANVVVPTVMTGNPPSKFERVEHSKAISATLTGTLDPEGVTAKYHFEYRAIGGEFEAAYERTPSEEGGSSNTPVEVQAVVALKPDTPYEFRLVGENANGVSYGIEVAFKKFTLSAVPGVSTGGASGVTSAGALLEGALSTGKIATKYHFEYGETEGYGKSTPEAETSAGSEAVTATVSGLGSTTTYHFRLVATNELGTTYGQDSTFTTLGSGAPTVVSESSESLSPPTTSGEIVKAAINPQGKAVHYHFEYGESETYGLSTASAEIPAGEKPVAVSAELVGLHPGSIYHFRVVAESEEGKLKSTGSDLTFTTSEATGALSPALLDGRGYELVSPPDKHGGYIEPLTLSGGPIQASENGNALAYVVIGPVVESPEGTFAPEAEQVVATRGSTSWSSQEIVTPSERPREARDAGSEYRAFSSDLALALVQPLPSSYTPLAEPPLAPPTSEAERGRQEKTIYLRANVPIAPAPSQTAIYEEAVREGERLAQEHGETSAPGFLPLVTAANTPPGTHFGGSPLKRGSVGTRMLVLDGTPDLSHIVLESTVPLATEGPSAPGIYEWAAGKLQLVSVLPGSNRPATGRVELGSGVRSQRPTDYRHAISEDGTRVVWTQEPVGAVAKGYGHLYMRDTATHETVQLDVPQAGVNGNGADAVFQLASSDGSRVFFTDTQPLTSTSKATVTKPDLYVCEMEEVAGELKCNLSDLTALKSGGESAGVQGAVLGAAENGSYVYFVATGVLATGAQAGSENLYVAHYESGAWATSFIDTLSSEDAPDWKTFDAAAPFVPELLRQTARVSPNGRYLAFMSNRSLTGYNNIDVNEESGRHADEEVFLYKADSRTVSCASCNPSGARPKGVLDTELAGEGKGLRVDRPETWARQEGEDHWLAGSIPGWTAVSLEEALHQPRYLDDNGQLFFTSADALVNEAAGQSRKETVVSGKEPVSVGVEDVYEYEPNEAGSCRSEAGCVALISSGSSDHESAFLDASVSGSDAFLLTAAKLVPQDEDTSYDIYDARVCSESSPCEGAPQAPASPCGDSSACRGSSTTGTPAVETPSSSTFVGPGNLVHVLPSSGTLPAKVSKPAASRKQKLARALKQCHRLPRKTRSQKLRRARCESQAKRRYAVRKKK